MLVFKERKEKLHECFSLAGHFEPECPHPVGSVFFFFFSDRQGGEGNSILF